MPSKPSQPSASPSVPKPRVSQSLPQINRNAAGIDIGGSLHWVAVPADRDPEPVRSFGTTTNELHHLADWLVACGIDTVAMESTGVYWIPLYELLEERGLEVILANAHHVKSVPGRKTDVLDCQWLQQLHSFGLLRGSFRPTAQITALRSLVRHRARLVQGLSAYIQRMQKSLLMMNVQLTNVLSDVTGKTGLAIIRDIVAGQTDPVELARHRDERCKASSQELVAALQGHYRPEQVFMLKQILELHDQLQEKIAACDLEIERCLDRLQADCEPPHEPMPPQRQQAPRRSEPRFDVRSPLYRIWGGVDLTQVPGIGPLNALKLLGEIGTDMSCWPTEKHFTSWLTLAPQNKISGGRRLSSKTQPSANRAAQVLRLAVMSNSRSDNALAAYYRRLAVRIGTAKAITATARKLAVILYNMLKNRQPYRQIDAATYNTRQLARRVRRLSKQAQELGYQLLPTDPPLDSATPVS